MASLSSAVPSCCVCWSSLSVTGSGARTTYLTVATTATVRKRSDKSVTTTRSPRFARFFFFFGLRRGSLSRPMLGS